MKGHPRLAVRDQDQTLLKKIEAGYYDLMDDMRRCVTKQIQSWVKIPYHVFQRDFLKNLSYFTL